MLDVLMGLELQQAVLVYTVTPCLKINKNSKRQEQQVGNVNSFSLTWFLSSFLSFVLFEPLCFFKKKKVSVLKQWYVFVSVLSSAVYSYRQA